MKISDDERGGWSSDRPRRDGAPPRPADLTVHCQVLRPADRLRYSPGSLLIVSCASRAELDAFLDRLIEERAAVLSLRKVKALLAGRVGEEELDERAGELLPRPSQQAPREPPDGRPRDRGLRARGARAVRADRGRAATARGT